MNSTSTFYDTPERSDEQTISREVELVDKEKLVNNILEGFPELAVILDENRQIIACNTKAIKGFGKNSREEIIGKRVGEAINCIHRNEMGEDTCGTSKFCAECGAAHAIKHTRENHSAAEEECRISSDLYGNETSFDFRVSTSPLTVGKRDFTLFAIRDISGDKRRQALERIFFHDVLNTASVVNGIAQIIDDADENEFDELLNSLRDSSGQLIDEIQMQRDLRNAEDGHLQTDPEPLLVNDILKKVHSLYINNKLAEDKTLSLELVDRTASLETDKRLLVRSFGNLVKNAIEASDTGNEIKLWAEIKNDRIKFSVNNPDVIPSEIQVQIFKRSFSTKGGSGRGIGTYSVKLLVEQYLGGKVFFNSVAGEGTTFTIELPFE